MGAMQQFGISDHWIQQMVDRSFKTPIEYARSSVGWRREVMGALNYYHYMAEFWVARHDPSVLVLCYEDVAGTNRMPWIQLIGKFMGIEMSNNLTDTVLRLTSKEFMAQHVEKFDESGIVERINQNNGAPIADVPYTSAV